MSMYPPPDRTKSPVHYGNTSWVAAEPFTWEPKPGSLLGNDSRHTTHHLYLGSSSSSRTGPPAYSPPPPPLQIRPLPVPSPTPPTPPPKSPSYPNFGILRNTQSQPQLQSPPSEPRSFLLPPNPKSPISPGHPSFNLGSLRRQQHIHPPEPQPYVLPPNPNPTPSPSRRAATLGADISPQGSLRIADPRALQLQAIEQSSMPDHPPSYVAPLHSRECHTNTRGRVTSPHQLYARLELEWRLIFNSAKVRAHETSPKPTS